MWIEKSDSSETINLDSVSKIIVEDGLTVIAFVHNNGSKSYFRFRTGDDAVYCYSRIVFALENGDAFLNVDEED